VLSCRKHPSSPGDPAMRKEHASTVGQICRWDPGTRRLVEPPRVDDPVPPQGEGWALVAATVDEKFVYWFWQRELDD
jgi:hypothetical protein